MPPQVRRPPAISRGFAGLSARSGGVEQVQTQGLVGGATLLVYGDQSDVQLAKAAKAAGFALWPLGNAAEPLLFRIVGQPDPLDPKKLQETLKAVEGIGELDIRTDREGSSLAVTRGRATPETIIASGRAAGFTLLRVESVSLPSLLPVAGRNTPPDFEERVLEAQAKLNELAPDFTLLGKDGKETLSLSQFRGKKPVVLMFGSCT